MAVDYLSGSGAVISNLESAAMSGTWPYDSLSVGADRVLVVSIMHENGIAGPSSITYGGFALSLQEGLVVNPADNFSETGEIWTLVNPPTGINNVVATGAGSGRDGTIWGAVYTGVNQAAPVGNTGTNSALRPNSGETVSITKQTEDNAISWLYVHDQSNSIYEAAANNTLINSIWTDEDGDGYSASGSGIGYRLTGSGVVIAGAVYLSSPATGGGHEDNGVVAIELMAAPLSPNTPINLGFANLQPDSVRLTWEQG